MGKTSVLIEIDEEEYGFLKDLEMVNVGRGGCKTIQQNVINAIKHGKVITDDTISREEMKKMVEGWLNMDKYYHPYSKGKTIPTDEVFDLIEHAPALAKTDKEI